LSNLSDPDCIFCGDEPCVTHADRKKKPRKSKQTGSVQSESVLTSPQSLSPDTNSDLFAWNAAQESKFAAKAESASILSEDELIEREAIRNLAPILSKSALRTYHDQLETPKDARLSRQGAELRRQLGDWDA
jgi:hypothetical protein